MAVVSKADRATRPKGPPALGPLDAPISWAHVADLRAWIAEYEAKGKPRKSEAIREALRKAGIDPSGGHPQAALFPSTVLAQTEMFAGRRST